jgi:hypothetical protein
LADLVRESDKCHPLGSQNLMRQNWVINRADCVVYL